MIIDSAFLEGSMTRIVSIDTLIVGSGVSGLKAAVTLYDRGVEDILVITDEKENHSVSACANGDGQSYLRLGASSSRQDSVWSMARDLCGNNEVDGTTAYLEAALSVRGYDYLSEIGVPFDENDYGEPQSRGVSSYPRVLKGPGHLSRDMMLRLKNEADHRGIEIWHNYQLVRILTDRTHSRAIGAVVLNKSGVQERYQRFILFNCRHLILAGGGEGGLYRRSAYPQSYIEASDHPSARPSSQPNASPDVTSLRRSYYPQSHTGVLGLALQAGARAVNLPLSSFGPVMMDESLMLDGGFFKSFPLLFSVDKNGRDTREFLLQYLPPGQVLHLLKEKGSHWAFEAEHVLNKDGSADSSLLDMLIYHETMDLSRHVFMDFRQNPSGLKEDTLPYERLQRQYPDAYQALLDVNVDPQERPVEICIGIAHHNGGLEVDEHSETSLKELYAVGEAAGSHGHFMVPGSSLNQTQVSAYACARYIASSSQEGDASLALDAFIAQIIGDFHECVRMADTFLNTDVSSASDMRERSDNIRALQADIGLRMDKAAGIFRERGRIEHELNEAMVRLQSLPSAYRYNTQYDLSILFRSQDLLVAQIADLSAMLNRMEHDKSSSGSSWSYDKAGRLPHRKLNEMYRFSLNPQQHEIQVTSYDPVTMKCRFTWRSPKPLPQQGS